MKYNSVIGKGFSRWSEGEYTPGQILAFNDFDSSFVLLSGSYRSGKTEILARIIIRHCLSFPGAKVGVFRAHLASLKKSTLLTVLELIHPSWVKSWSNTELVLEFVNDSKLSFIGADFPDRLGSIELTLAAIDEAAEVSEESQTMIQGRLSGTLQKPPNFEDLPDNIKEYITKTLDLRQTFLACNPKSTGHYLYKIFFEEPKPGHKAYISNSIANRNLPVNYLVQNLAAYVRGNKSIQWVREQINLIRNGEKDFNGLHLKEYLTPLGARNLLGLWTALEGAIYDLDETRHLLESIPSNWVATGNIYCGVDFGFHNPRITVLKEHKRITNRLEETCYAAIDYWAGESKTGEDLIAALDDLLKKHNWRYVYFPHDQPGQVKLARSKFGASKLKKGKTSVFSGISTVASFFNRDRLVFIKNKGYELAWKEFDSYEWQRDREGNFKDEPVKKDDHYPDSVRYLIYTRHYKDNSTEIPGETGYESFYGIS